MLKFEEEHKKLRSNLRNQKAIDFLEKRSAFTRSFLEQSNVAFVSKEDLLKMPKEVKSFLALNESYADRLLFPTFIANGEFSGYIGRSIDEGPAKYQLPQHFLFEKQTAILGLNDIFTKDYCFVTENIFEWIRVKECGFQAISLNGAYQSEYKRQIIATLFNKGVVIMITDNDKAGLDLRNYFAEFLDNENILNDYVSHTEKGLDEFFVKNGKEATTKLLNTCLNNF